MAQWYPSKGAEILSNWSGTAKSLAGQSGVSQSVISRLKSGDLSAPSARDQERLRDVAGIPVEAWARNPRPEDALADADSGDSGQSDQGGTSPLTHLAVVRSWRRKLQSRGALAKDVTAALEAERRAVELVHKAARENFEAIVELIVETLAPYPDARRAVESQLRAKGL